MIRALLLLILLVSQGCGPSPSSAPEGPTFGPPVGVELPASGKVPTVMLAVATTRPGALDKIIEPLTGAVHGGLSACPQYVERARSGGDATLVIHLGRGALMVEPGTNEDDVSRCMAKAIDRPSPGLPADPGLKARVQVIIKDAIGGTP